MNDNINGKHEENDTKTIEGSFQIPHNFLYDLSCQ